MSRPGGSGVWLEKWGYQAATKEGWLMSCGPETHPQRRRRRFDTRQQVFNHVYRQAKAGSEKHADAVHVWKTHMLPDEFLHFQLMCVGEYA